jgi:HD-GYP domain-containing protein (c-di-GMP phosphodiesterase class II)
VPSAWQAALAAEPGLPGQLGDAEIDDAARTIGEFADLKGRLVRGHSAAVARLAEEAGRRAGLGAGEVTELRRAGHLHDVGRVGVTAAIWDKAGPLTDAERERVRLHAYYTERVLARAPALAGVAALAAADHERLDGSGYHRRIPAAAIGPAARILAAADVLAAMTEDRPHRPALPLDRAADELSREAAAGRLDPDAAAAVMAAAGLSRTPSRRERPAGLSEREVEVLRLVARGLTNKEVAAALEISPRTAGHHLEHVFEKVGVTTRAAATLFAMQNDLLR